MKATEILPNEELLMDNFQIICLIMIIIIALFFVYMVFFRSVPDLYGRVASSLKDTLHIESEDCGETNQFWLFSITVSAVTQHFDLNDFVGKMRKLGCNVLSTADTDNPSHRQLTVQVPKKRGGFGLFSVLLCGLFIGTIVIGYLEHEELYIRFKTMVS